MKTSQKNSVRLFGNSKQFIIFALAFEKMQFMVVVAQLVRASDCGSEGRRFETDLPPSKVKGSRSFPFCFHDTLCFIRVVKTSFVGFV